MRDSAPCAPFTAGEKACSGPERTPSTAASPVTCNSSLRYKMDPHAVYIQVQNVHRVLSANARLLRVDDSEHGTGRNVERTDKVWLSRSLDYWDV